MFPIIYLNIPLIFGLIVLTSLQFNSTLAYFNLKQSNLANIYKGIAFYVSLLSFFITFYYIYYFDICYQGFQFTSSYCLLNSTINFGVDGVSIFFLLLTTFLIPVCLIISWDYINQNVLPYLVSFLLLEILLILFFTALNLMIFYIIFESILIPMFLIIGLWGGGRKIKASYYFFMFTLLGSVLMLLGLLIV